jgi:hypothetical protein
MGRPSWASYAGTQWVLVLLYKKSPDTRNKMILSGGDPGTIEMISSSAK